MEKEHKLVACCLGIICFTTIGCLKDNTIQGFTINELKKKDGVMFTATNQNWGLVCDSEDYWSDNHFTVYYNGSIHVQVNYNLSGNVIDETFKLSHQDYKKLICYLDGKFKDNQYIQPNACDGEGWKFEYYDTNGKLIAQYSGYIYGLKPLEEIQEMLETYIPQQ